MYRLQIANRNYSSWSLRPWLLMTELGIPFEEVLTPFGEPDFKAFSPTGKVPCLHDTALGQPTVVWDSLAITEYLAERHPEVWPTGRAFVQHLLSRPAMRQWEKLALAEAWRDEAHEADARAKGVWVQDLRQSNAGNQPHEVGSAPKG